MRFAQIRVLGMGEGGKGEGIGGKSTTTRPGPPALKTWCCP